MYSPDAGMAEYVITEVGRYQWLVFADRQSIFAPPKTRQRKSARNRRSRQSADNPSEQGLPAKNQRA
jgi:hypothetical protein